MVIMKRPLIPVALFLVLGVLLGALPVPLALLFAASFLLVLLFIVWARARPALLCALIVLAGWTDHAQRTAIVSPRDLRVILGQHPAIVTVYGKLRATPLHRLHHDVKKNIYYSTTTAEIEVSWVRKEEGNWQPAFGAIETTTKGDLPDTFFAGQTVELEDGLEPASGPVAEGLFDYRSYLSGRGIYYEMRLEGPPSWTLIASNASRPLADRFCAWAKHALARGLPVEDESLQLEWALTLGWKAALTDDVSEPFIRAATYHIFAVDGLRIAIIAAILIGLFRAVGIPRAYCGLLAAPLIFFYAAMTGWPASAVRAIVMIMVIFVGWTLKRPSDLINSLFAAAIIILLWEPRQLYQAGFQLSFFVVLCIILILPFFERIGERLLRPDPLLPESLRPRWQRWLHPPARYLIDLLLTSTAAWLGSIPLVALYFHLVTPLSGPANVIAVPLCGLVLICNLSSLLLVGWLPGIAVLFNHAGWFLMGCIRATSQWSSRWPGAYFYLPMPSLFTIGVYYFILLAALTGWLFAGRRRRWKMGAVILLCLIWCGQWLWERPATRLTVLPTEGGHAIYARGPGWNNDWLIDCGGDYTVDNLIKPYLRAQGVNRLSHFVVTHGESDFSGGAQMACDLFRPRKIYISRAHFFSPDYNDFLAAMRTNSPLQPRVRPGDQLGQFAVLFPGSAARLRKTADHPMVLLAEINGIRLLLLSDLSHAGQNALLDGDTNSVRADIVVAGVPEAGEPLDDALLDAIQPRVIVIADSELPPGREASSELRERLALRNIPVFYTSRMRSVNITIRPGSWSVAAMDGTRASSSGSK
jgi:competence protein ComEC